VGSLMAAGTFAVTWSFFFTTPDVVKWSFSTDPIAWNLTGEFLFKDIVLLCVCVVLFLASLPRSVGNYPVGIYVNRVILRNPIRSLASRFSIRKT